MMNKAIYPTGYLREISSQAFEAGVDRLREMGGEAADLAEMLDAAFLIWQLAEDKGTTAQRTIGEMLPVLIGAIWEEGRTHVS